LANTFDRLTDVSEALQLKESLATSLA
jgi:hypothetical protein